MKREQTNPVDEKELKVEDPIVSSEKEEEGNFKPGISHILPIPDVSI